MTLRRRLLVGLLALVAVGVTVSTLVTYRSVRVFLYDRLDQQLVANVEILSFQLTGGRRGTPPRPGTSITRDDSSAPAGTWAAVVRPDGTVPTALCVGCRQQPFDAPRPQFDKDDLGRRRPVTVPGLAGGGRWRLVSTPEPNGDTLVFAAPLREVEQTIAKLVGIQLLAAAAVLGGVGLSAFFLIRGGLRPLQDMGRTAAAIAAGDLSRRVEHTDERTEVGQLGVAFNRMLGHIEHAFDAQQASEHRLRRFIADASHELRTPLTSIRGYAELFRRGAAERPEDLAKAMRRIEEEAARMGVLVDDLLLLARLDQGRALERHPVDLTAIAADAVDDARAVEPDRPVSLEAPASVVVSGDDLRLRQVAANLLANARQHTPPGTPVHVTVARNGDSASLVVADEGPGLAPEQAERVFERFYRADAARSRAQGGTGLGLAIVAAIAEAHGGRATADSEPGKGARFTVTLPAAGAGATAFPSEAAAGAGAPAETGHQGDQEHHQQEDQ
ncbi:MAG: sensor histidine kinase [Acidimicrobiia bacterium]